MMKTCVLSSGSKGNCTYVETSSHKYLIDLGRNKKYILEKLEEINVRPQDIDYILISHNHDDHVSGLENFIKTYNTKVCLTQTMLNGMLYLKNYENIILYDDVLKLDDDVITAVKSSHDSIDSKNFVIENKDKSLCYVTDTGYINQKNFKALENKTIYLFESNHDIEMLNNGPYPIWLKKRVLSDVGHLSNISSGVYLSKLIGDNTKHIMLIHLSETNNTPELALKTIKEIFSEYDIDFSNISYASQNEISEVIEI